MNPYDLAHQLARALKESQEYREYKQAKANMDLDDDKKKMIEDYRQKQMEIHKRQIMGEKVDEAEVQKLHYLFNILTMDDQIKYLVEAEMRLARLLNDIYKIIEDAIKLEEQ